MAKAKFDIKTEATRPLYAGVGVTDLAVEAARAYVTDVQKRFEDLQKSGLDFQPKAQRAAIESRVAELRAEFQNLVSENVATVSGAYAELAKRGEVLVGRIRRQQSTQATVKAADTTSAKAKTTRTQATKTTKSAAKTATAGARSTARKTTRAVKESSAPSSAKATATAAKTTVSNAMSAAADAAEKVGD
jgi:hypothetical protein